MSNAISDVRRHPTLIVKCVFIRFNSRTLFLFYVQIKTRLPLLFGRAQKQSDIRTMKSTNIRTAILWMLLSVGLSSFGSIDLLRNNLALEQKRTNVARAERWWANTHREVFERYSTTNEWIEFSHDCPFAIFKFECLTSKVVSKSVAALIGNANSERISRLRRRVFGLKRERWLHNPYVCISHYYSKYLWYWLQRLIVGEFDGGGRGETERNAMQRSKRAPDERRPTMRRVNKSNRCDRVHASFF